MKNLTLFLLIAILLTACAPGAPIVTPEPQAPVLPTPTGSGVVPTTPEATSTATSPVPSAAEAARLVLAQQKGANPEEILIVNVGKVDWPDACLGLSSQGQTCAQVITPGYRVTLEFGGHEYLFHTDEAGSQIHLASGPAPQTDSPLIRWTLESGAGCETAEIGENAVLFGACDQPLMEGRFVLETRLEDLAYFTEKYMSFEAETAAGEVVFNGQGQVTATPAEQRMIAEWSRLVAQEAAAGRSGASWGLAFAWHREGGIAGFCEDVTVYLSGEAFASSCGGQEPTTLGRVWLTSNQLTALYDWGDSLQPLEYEHIDPATADALTIRIVFTGAGERDATDADLQAIQELAQDILAQATASAAPEDLAEAQETLVSFFNFLTDGEFEQAVELYGGDYGPLTDNNPEIDPSDKAALLEAGCTRNGLQCLTVKAIVNVAPLSESDYRFTVEFQNRDGSLFALGPCCGEDPDAFLPFTQFDYLVEKVGDQFKVLDLPVYVP